MNKETKDSLINSIPELINNRNVEYETDLSLLLRDEGYTNLRIGDIRKILKNLDITLKQGKRNNKNISTNNNNNNNNNNKEGKRTREYKKRENPPEKYGFVLSLLKEGKSPNMAYKLSNMYGHKISYPTVLKLYRENIEGKNIENIRIDNEAWNRK